MALTSTLCRAFSWLSTLVSASPAARLTLVGVELAPGALAPMFSTLTMRPQLRLRMPGSARRASRMAANSLRSRSLCQSSSVTVSNGFAWLTPALLTRMSTLPKSATTWSKVSAIRWALETSQE